MKAANVYVRCSYRIHIACRLASESGMLPVNTIENQEMTAITCPRTRNPYSTAKCGMASNQFTSGRQFVTFSGGSNVNVAGYGADEGCMSFSHQLTATRTVPLRLPTLG